MRLRVKLVPDLSGAVYTGLIFWVMSLSVSVTKQSKLGELPESPVNIHFLSEDSTQRAYLDLYPPFLCLFFGVSSCPNQGLASFLTSFLGEAFFDPAFNGLSLGNYSAISSTTSLFLGPFKSKTISLWGPAMVLTLFPSASFSVRFKLLLNIFMEWDSSSSLLSFIGLFSRGSSSMSLSGVSV